jgi:plastocyanin
MKKLFTIFSLLFSGLILFAGQITVTNSGATFTPADITINQGDTVIFQISTSHNVVEVSQATYDANGNTSNGGFTLPFGGGSIVLANAGKYYYVCAPHANIGMKGTITVSSLTGISDIANASFKLVYSNPSSGYVFVSFYLKNNSSVTYSLFDITGKKVYSRVVPQVNSGLVEEIIRPESKLSKGIYILKAQIGDGTVLKNKVIVE